MDPATYTGSISLAQQAKGKPGAGLQTTGNPFADSYFYLSPDISTMMDYSLKQVSGDATLTDKIKYIQRQPSAIWMDSTATIAGDPAAGRRSLEGHLDAAVAQQKFFEMKDGRKSPMTIVIIVYNLPDRDCAAFASGGQLFEIGKPKNPQPNNGLAKYRDEYIRGITSVLSKKQEYKDLRIVALLEPDSFPNMITNTKLNPDGPSLKWPELMTADGTTYCDTLLSYSSPGLTSGLGVYGRGLQIAIEELYKVGNVYTYLDIAHAGWLGWDGNLKRAVTGFQNLIKGANTDGIDGFKKVKGFASNTSGYTPVEEPLISNAESARQALSDWYEWNTAVDEVTYIDAFNTAFRAAQSGYQPGFIIDTARNGWGAPNRPKPGTGTKGTVSSNRVDKRAHRGHWCNVNKAGVGEVPKAAPISTKSHLHAFFWMKPPGEADGISFDVAKYPKGSAAYNALDAVDKAIVDDASDPKYAGKTLDTMCTPGGVRDGMKTVDVVPALSPQAGGWFHKQFLMLINNAYPALGTTDYGR
ncbi:MAG TPA: glycoside hydrolase family 6 protein [Cellvibrionaceae bacterium]|nr:glycoside hydrolase family 6 protein [Cellvibrionaceae bacterium]